MIQCEECVNWFHFKCVGISAKEASKIEKFVCQKCSKQNQQEIEQKVRIFSFLKLTQTLGF